MKRTLLIITFVVSALLLVSFFSIDACMDAGGLWSSWGLNCEGASADFVPQYKRTAPVFWTMVLLLSGLTTFLIGKLVSNAKP